jgi:hypothetical protein
VGSLCQWVCFIKDLLTLGKGFKRDITREEFDFVKVEDQVVKLHFVSVGNRGF